MKKVSVIIPVFNRAAYIQETILSVLSQDYSDIELIVVDDGSTDGGYEVILGLEREHGFVVLIHEERANKGQSVSINLGLEASNGDYIAVLDSDDLFLPGKLSSQVQFLEENPDVDLVYGKGQAIDSEGNLLYNMLDDNHVENNDPNEILLDCYFLLPQNSLVRKEVYERVGGFDVKLRSGQDHDMLVRMAETAKFAFCPDLVFQYRRHADSISVTGQETRWRAAFVILEKARNRFPYRKGTIRKRKAVINYRLAMAFWEYKKNRVEAILRLLWSGILDPLRALKVFLGIEKSW